MAKAWLPYIVRPHESIAQLAFLRGTTVDEVWGHAKNVDLAALRENPNVLAPGDIVYLPPAPTQVPKPVTAGGAHSFTADIPQNEISLLLKDEKGKPLGDLSYEVEIDGRRVAEQASTSKPNGAVTVQIPVVAKQVTLLFPDYQMAIPVVVSGLDPLASSAGPYGRLANIGYYTIQHRSDRIELLARQASLLAFQEDHDLALTGEPDEGTLNKLKTLVGGDKGA